jgi:ABC transporter, ATP-binding subunit, PQQ-dependent alcohol dehydrogenase system
VKALSIQGLSHAFGHREALRALDLCVEKGRFAVLLGPNGAGKTTLVSLLTGLYAAQHGEISILGHSLRKSPLEALAALGVVFQSPTLDLDLSVIENLRYHASLRGLTHSEADLRAKAELSRFGMEERTRDKVRSLSGGLRRRVEIARALMHAPQLLIVDEVTAGLDVATRQLLMTHVRRLCDERILSVLWTTHLLDEVQPDDALYVLHRGMICWQGNAGGLMQEGGSLTDAFLRLTERPA